MKQLGNLAIVCAKRKNVLMQIYHGKVTVYLGDGPSRSRFTVDWSDDEQIERFIYDLNHGAYKTTDPAAKNTAA